MRGISEKRLREYKRIAIQKGIQSHDALLYALIEECQELNPYETDQLLPMSEAPKDGRYIKVIFWSGTNQYHSEMIVCWNKKHEAWEEYMVDPEDETFPSSTFNGWIPIAIYKEPVK